MTQVKIKKEDAPKAPQPMAPSQHLEANTPANYFAKPPAQQPTVVSASKNPVASNPVEEIAEKQDPPKPGPSRQRKPLHEMDPFGADDDANFVSKKRQTDKQLLPHPEMTQEKMAQLAQFLGLGPAQTSGQSNDRYVQPYQPSVRAIESE